jgi:MraZ protein
VTAFIGTHVNKIDAKGRISVPASFRAVVQARGLMGVALYPSPLDEPCLEGCGMDHIENLSNAMPVDPLPAVEQDAIAHLIIGTAHEALFDGGGRIVLPEEFMKRAGLTDKGAFVGKGRTFQIWEPAALADAQNALRNHIIATRRRQIERSGG